jgi:hypothetical protein
MTVMDFETGNDLRWYQSSNSGSSWSERMRLDSSGNLLVGKTSANSNAVGIELHSNDIIKVTRSGGATGYFNRQTSDGNILELAKDGATVGNIGTFGGTTYFSSNTHAIMINGTAITPSLNTGNRVDGAMDLGASGYRFKDAYLSGGVYLGGVGSANKLDDYEEGTFTPVLDNVSCSYSAQTGTYTKVGNLVTARFEIGVTGLNTGDGSGFQIGDLPFVCGASGVLFTMDTENSNVITNKQNVLGARPIVSADGVRLTDNGGEYAYNNGTSSSGSLIGMVQYFTT